MWLPDAEIGPTFGSLTGLDRPIALVADVSTSPILCWIHVDHLLMPTLLPSGFPQAAPGRALPL
jgi:hypothetical protein